MLSPGGNAIGTLHVGNYKPNPGATLLIHVGSDNNCDLLEVSGVANLAGTNLQIQPLNGEESCGEFTILTAGGGVNGTFAQVTGDSELLDYELVYNANSVQLIIPCIALEQTAPLIAGNIAPILFNIANTQYGQITTRLAAIRAGVSGISLNGLSQEPMMEQFSKRESRIKNREGKTLAYAPEPSRFDIFVNASGIFSCMNNIYDLPKLHSISGYFGGGADYRVSENIYLGVYAGYQGSKAWYSGGNRLCSNGVKFGLYGTAEWAGFSYWDRSRPAAAGFSKHKNIPTQSFEWEDNFYANFLVGGGVNCVNLRRSINTGIHHYTARSHPFVGELDSLFGVGYEFQLGPWRLGINNSIQYTYLGISAFTESGAKNLNMHVGSQTPNSLVYTLGGNISYWWEIAPTYLLLPTVGLYWQHEFLNHGYTVNANFAGRRDLRNRNFSTAAGARNNAFGMAGITAQLGTRLGAYAYYNPQFGGGQINSQGVVVGITCAF